MIGQNVNTNIFSNLKKHGTIKTLLPVIIFIGAFIFVISAYTNSNVKNFIRLLNSVTFISFRIS